MADEKATDVASEHQKRATGTHASTGSQDNGSETATASATNEKPKPKSESKSESKDTGRGAGLHR